MYYLKAWMEMRTKNYLRKVPQPYPAEQTSKLAFIEDSLYGGAGEIQKRVRGVTVRGINCVGGILNLGGNSCRRLNQPEQ